MMFSNKRRRSENGSEEAAVSTPQPACSPSAAAPLAPVHPAVTGALYPPSRDKALYKFLTEKGFGDSAFLDTLQIVHNPPAAVLVEEAMKYEPGACLTSTGALASLSGPKTGRSPQDKRIVEEEISCDDVWWGPVNMKLSKYSFLMNRERAMDYLGTRKRLYVVDGYAGWDKRYQVKVRTVAEHPSQALFMQVLLRRLTEEELEENSDPDYCILNAGSFVANRHAEGNNNSLCSVAISFEKRELIILGSGYAGEMKKGVFTIMHYLMPKAGVLSLHASANENATTKETTLFFGLSGTGKTTLSADPNRRLIGDDEHCWTDKGIFNIEGGCYAKCANLSAEAERDIFAAVRFGSVLENVVMDPYTRVVDYTDVSITENTRCAYPIEFMPNARIPCMGGHPTNLVFLMCDAFGVIPPVARLTTSQAVYHFLSGYTAKIAGTETGIKEPQATFSACFGQPFLVFHPARYGKMLSELMEKHQSTCWLVNTGWTGGQYGVGRRMSLAYSRAVIDAIHSGALDPKNGCEYETFEVFGLHVPKHCPGVPDSVLHPSQNWKDQNAFKETLNQLAELFKQNFAHFASEASPEVIAAGPK